MTATMEQPAPIFRWHATITYRTDAGPNAVEHEISELAELHDLIERGPHWDTVIEIEIRRHGTIRELTVEQAARE